ncbi:MAG: sensor histidine kinase [Sulfitobacter sp.]|uniref:sensor histidine kinase n=1 Tax=Sulfitobacter sp. TaxID=1903071 RepID=UPI0040586BC4
MWSLFLCATVLIVLTAYRLDRLSYANFIQQVRTETYLELLVVKENFQSVVHEQSLSLRELATFLGENPDITQAEFSDRAQKVRGGNDSIINIAVAPDLVISMIYPIEGNEGALGLNYRENAEQLPAVQRALNTGRNVLAGPINLAQGGVGLIMRAPLYYSENQRSSAGQNIRNQPRSQGIVSVVLDYQKFLDQTGISQAATKYDLLIDAADPVGTDGSVSLFGDPTVKDQDPVKLDFDFAFENWHLLATPKGGWPDRSTSQWEERLVMAIVASSLLALLGYILWLAETRKSARMLLSDGIEALNDGFVMFDKDDRLILSNAKYQELYNLPSELLRPGTPFKDIVKAGFKGGKLSSGNMGEEEWIAKRVHARRVGGALQEEHHLADGKVIKVSDQLMQNGHSVGLRVDMTEFSKAKAAAEAASEAKSDFMGLLSHELRTPLTVILGVARLSANARLLGPSKELLAALETRDADPKELEVLANRMFDQLSGMMDRMIQSGEHLLHLINEMLDIAKIEAGSLTIIPTVCDTSEIVDPVVQQLTTLSSAKGLEFQVSSDQGSVYVDKVRTRQILFNLVGNAIKFTEAGRVKLTVTVDENTAVFEVCDTGNGIPADEYDSIFDAFYQIDSTATRRAGGTGMGLAISRSLAELQGGTLTVASTMGEGSCFSLTLPTTAPSDPNPGLDA